MKIVFDTETTGLNPQDNDEILQLTIIDFNGSVLFDEYFKPIKNDAWPDAMKINHITPEMLRDKKPFSEYIKEIQSIFDSADEIIAYNIEFDRKMVENQGIVFPNVNTYDVMLEFAPIYGNKDPNTNTYRPVKLSMCADYYDYEFDAHNSLEDTKATLHCYKCLNSDFLYRFNMSEATGFSFSETDNTVFTENLKEYLDFLFRTDTLQRWQNDRTLFNQVITCDNDKIKKWKIINKYKVRAGMREKIENQLGKSSPSILYKTCISWPNCNEINFIEDKMINQLKELMKEIISDNILLCCITHMDEYDEQCIVPKVYLIYMRNLQRDKCQLQLREDTIIQKK